jgi:16S rRNA (uracil1498-N3)-methyltransferase
LTGSVVHYLARVLRLSPGAPLILFNGDGKDYAGQVTDIQRRSICVKLSEARPLQNESDLKITLVQAISRGERMDHSLQKATELGVFCIQPVISQRVEVRLDENRRAKRKSHWQGVVVAACEQSGRAVVPEVKAPVSLLDWLAMSDHSPRLMLEPSAKTRLSSFPVTASAVSILVGPEGGFDAEEAKALKAGGLTAVSLGPRVLRTETAGPAAIAVLQAAAGDL